MDPEEGARSVHSLPLIGAQGCSWWGTVLLLLNIITCALCPWAPWCFRWHALWGYVPLLAVLAVTQTRAFLFHQPSPSWLLICLHYLWLVLTDIFFVGSLPTEVLALSLPLATLLASNRAACILVSILVIAQEIAMVVARSFPQATKSWAPGIEVPSVPLLWGGFGVFLAVFILVGLFGLVLDQPMEEPSTAGIDSDTDHNALIQRLQTEVILNKRLLHNLLPAEMANEMFQFLQQAPAGGGPASVANRLACSLMNPGLLSQRFIPRTHEFATVMFADIVGFTKLVHLVSPEELILTLDTLFSQFDDACRALGVEKIKTIGDCYMCATLAPHRGEWEDRAASVLRLAAALHSLISRCSLAHRPLALRAGVHCGPVVAGIIGKLKFCYDMWGDTVNVASRMESQGVPNTTQVTEQVRDLLKESFVFEARGPLHLKNWGMLFTFLHHPTPNTITSPTTSPSRGANPLDAPACRPLPPQARSADLLQVRRTSFPFRQDSSTPLLIPSRLDTNLPGAAPLIRDASSTVAFAGSARFESTSVRERQPSSICARQDSYSFSGQDMFSHAGEAVTEKADSPPRCDSPLPIAPRLLVGPLLSTNLGQMSPNLGQLSPSDVTCAQNLAGDLTHPGARPPLAHITTAELADDIASDFPPGSPLQMFLPQGLRHVLDLPEDGEWWPSAAHFSEGNPTILGRRARPAAPLRSLASLLPRAASMGAAELPAHTSFHSVFSEPSGLPFSGKLAPRLRRSPSPPPRISVFP
eukprot:GGOE01009052.1.p1 GENE.GGOE01009052.1~~GGOE01009052.1.p1  ORF type:complete len:756 (-),score=182.37 GGOE01009052.1:1354-3621(-)